MIAKLFMERSKRFNARCAKYSRYVFNDHFILVLLFLLGFVLVQYSQLLRHFPKNPWAIILGLLVLCLLLPFWGNIVTYLEPADKHYLLVKEEEVLDHVKKATGRAFRFWVIVQSLIFILVIPLFLALGLPVWGVILVAVAMAILKYFIFQKKAQPFYRQSGLNWTEAIAAENKRQQSILKFFSLFTNVKGISNSVKRRAYLDGLTNILPKRQSTTWQNIYLRSYLRNGDFLALTIRLLFLSLLGIGFISQSWIAAIFVALLNYLLLFQLTALYHAFDYQYLTFLFPLEINSKLKGVKQVIALIGYSVLFVETMMALLFFQDRVALLFMIGITLLLYVIYLPFKLRSLVD